MPISITGTGTITGISAGGLPDDCITTAEIAGSAVTTAKVTDGNITFAKLSSSATEADNVAKRTAKAWASIRGTGTVTILASFNVSSITDNNRGDYTVNFTIPMQDVYYAMIGTASDENDDAAPIVFGFKNNSLADRTTTAQAFEVSTSGTRYDSPLINLVVFR